MGETEDSCGSGRRSERDLLVQALRSFSREDYSVRLPSGQDGVDEELALAFNAAAETNERCAVRAKNRITHDPATLAGIAQELRTPLNAMLTLARVLAENNDRNLTAKQVAYAQTIYSSGTDLMSLIDNLVDLARIGAGKLAVTVEPVAFGALREQLLAAFSDEEDGADGGFDVELAPGLPDAMQTDGERLQQLLRGLLANFLKPPRRGRVVLHIAPAALDAGEVSLRVAFSVGGPGGDALSGMSVWNELAQCLQGEISVPGPAGAAGFVLLLPLTYAAEALPTSPLGEMAESRSDGILHPRQAQTYYGRRSRSSDEGAVLIADGDPRLAAVMLGLVRGDGYQAAVVTDSGMLEARLKDFRPDVLLLGERLHDIDSWALLRRLRQMPATRLLPIAMIHIRLRSNRYLQIAGSPGMPVFDDLPLPSRVLAQLGVVAGHGMHRILLAAPPGPATSEGAAALAATGVEVSTLASADEVVAALRQRTFDGAIVAPALGDVDAIELLHRLALSEVPVDLPLALLDPAALATETGDDCGDAGGGEIALLRHRERFDKVLEDTAVFLERAIGNLTHPRSGGPEGRRGVGTELSGMNVLVVDRNVRSLYALTGALEQQGVHVNCAQDGMEGTEMLRAAPDIDVVIAGVAADGPEGPDFLRVLRAIHGPDGPPIVAVVPRGAPIGHSACIDAGASDCLERPVNSEHLLSLLRVLQAQKR